MKSRGKLFVGLLTRQARYMTDSDINKKAVVIRCSTAVHN